MSKKDPYRPIACGAYDWLELQALRKVHVRLKYSVPGGAAFAEGCIEALYSREGVEYLRLDTGFVCRLDALLMLNDELIAAWC